MKKIIIFCLIFITIMWVVLLPQTYAVDGIPYNTYTYSQSMRRFVPTQDAYLPLSSQNALGNIPLSNPQDITVDGQDNIYVADGTRIIKYSLETDETTIIGEDILTRATGVHVDQYGNVYAADLGNRSGYQFSYDGSSNTYVHTATYERPIDTPYFESNEPFEPSKIVTDRSGIVYLLLAGNINGLGKFTNDGEFSGFFGGNQIPATFFNFIRNIVFDERQRREWFQMVPKPVYNIAVDRDGLILTTTRSEPGYLKLNIANIVFNQSSWGFNNIEDLFVGPYNTIFSVTTTGQITEYAPDGSILFIFSGTDTRGQVGLFRNSTGIAVDSKNNLYVIDSERSSMQVFVPTEFANLVHHALDLYQDGQYAVSLEPWQEVLRQNALFDIAHQGIGDAHFAQGNYEQALQSYMIARDHNGYSQAFWEVRNVALLNSGSIIIFTLLTLVVLYIVNQFVPIFSYATVPIKKGHHYLMKFKLYQELNYGFYILRKPSDGYYGVKREEKGSNLTALIYIFVFFIVYLIWIYHTNFLFNDFIAAEIIVFEQMVFVFVPLVLWVIANYLVCSIRDGEGKLSDVFQATAYALLPMIITLPILTVISQGLTNNEAFIYDTILSVGLILTIVYFIVMVKEIHFYGTRQTLFNILITIFTAVMLLAFVAIIYLLLNEIFGFFSDVIREVIIRG